MEAPALTTTDEQLVVGDIPAPPPGLQPRPALLAQLNRASQKPPVVLTGIWGAGKTQLAATYARARLADSWRLIAWINARNNETLLAGLAAVAKAAGLSAGGSRPGPADAGRAVRDWLEADGSFRLLVFDDVEDLGLLRPFVPSAGEARVLITAAREPITELGTSVRVDVFSAEEALALLDGRTGLADEDGALAVAVQLGYLPLALDQAAGMIAKQHVGYAAYLAKLRALSAEDHLVREDDEGGGGGGAAAALAAGRGGGGAAGHGGHVRRRPARCEHRGDGARGHAVAGGSPPRPAAFRRAGGHAARRRSPGGRVHGGSGAGTAERAVTAGFQP